MITIHPTNSYIKYNIEGEEFIQYHDNDYEFWHEICKMYAFDDCCNIKIIEAKWNGREVSYTGWKPDMLFTFKYIDNDEIAFEGAFPEWDH